MQSPSTPGSSAMSPFEATARELLAAGYSIRFRAEGDSMFPTIRSGERVEVAPLRGALPRPGDVILVRAVRGLTAHRVVEVQGHSILMRGDHAVGNDPILDSQAILGIVTGVEREGRLRSVAIRSLRGMRVAAAARRLRRHAARLAARGKRGNTQYRESLFSY
jgi:hypothetical protein